MTTNHPFSLFISSKMTELADERRAVQKALSQYRMAGWLWETDAGARPEPIRSTYLSEVEACDVYIRLFWQGYGPYTIEEYEHARLHHKPCLVYEKYVDVDKRSPELTKFLEGIEQVTNPTGLTVCRFTTAKELAEQVQKDVLHLLVTTFRQKFPYSQTTVQLRPGSISLQVRFGLVDRLLACPTIQDTGSRQTVLALLNSQISNAIPRNPVSRVDVANIVGTCLNYSAGVQELIDSVGYVEGNSPQVQELRRYWEEVKANL